MGSLNPEALMSRQPWLGSTPGDTTEPDLKYLRSNGVLEQVSPASSKMILDKQIMKQLPMSDRKALFSHLTLGQSFQPEYMPQNELVTATFRVQADRSDEGQIAKPMLMTKNSEEQEYLQNYGRQFQDYIPPKSNSQEER